MQAPLYRQHQVPAGLRLMDALDVLDGMAEAVLDDALTARPSAQPLIIRQLNTLLTDIIDVGKTDNMSRDLTSRIITTIFPLQRNTGYLQRHDLPGHVGVDMTLQVNEFATLARRQSVLQFLDRGLQ